MTMNVTPISANQPVSAVTQATQAVSPSALSPMVSAVVMSDEPVTVDMIPAAPPPEVIAAIMTASQSYDSLAASGHQVHFATDPQTGSVSIQLVGPSTSTTISPSKALDLASGGTPH